MRTEGGDVYGGPSTEEASSQQQQALASPKGFIWGPPCVLVKEHWTEAWQKMGPGASRVGSEWLLDRGWAPGTRVSRGPFLWPFQWLSPQGLTVSSLEGI